MTDLVTADVEVPNFLGHTLDTDGAGYGGVVALSGVGLGSVQPNSVVRPTDSTYFGVARACVARIETVEIGGLQPMQR